MPLGQEADTHSMSESYHLTEWHDKVQGSYVPEMLEPLEIKEGTTFVDLGCGSGYINAYVASRKCPGLNLGLELNRDTLLLAQRLNASPNTIHWVCASVEQIPLDTESMDTVVCRGVIMLAHVERMLSEIARILRPGGHAVLLMVDWTYYLRWVSLNPLQWKRSLAGFLHFLSGTWFNLTGHQVVLQFGSHRIGQTYQTEFRTRRILSRMGMRIDLIRRGPEFLLYVSKLDGAAR